ncbi:unnamed protein product [Calypogeia fissa]
MTSFTLASEAILAMGETSKMMEVSEEGTSMEASLCGLGEIDDENHDKDLSTVPLLSPDPSLVTETSTARSPHMEQDDQDGSGELRELGDSPLYMTCVADVVLRASALMLSFIALGFTAVNWKGDHWERSQNEFMNFYLSGYMLSVNVVVCLYSCATLSLTIFQSVNRDTRRSNNLLFLLSIFQLDQTFAYLLISATLNAFDSSRNLTSSSPQTKIGSVYERTLAGALVSLLAFFTLATTFLSSGYRLVSKLCKYSQNALEIPVDEHCDSPTAKLLP